MADDKAYVPGLDGLRALSITLVVLGHLGFGPLFPAGLGVTTFFFISGYLICGLLMAEQARFGRLDLARFYARRALRLAPEMLALLAVLGLVLAPLLGEPLPFGALLAGLFYWTNYYVALGYGTCPHCAVTGHMWSLAVEEHFYLLAPLAMVALVFAPRRLIALFVSVIVVGGLWRAYATFGLHLPELYTYRATECRLDSIAWGCLAAVLLRHSPDLVMQVRRWGAPIFGLGMGLLLISLAARDDGFRATWRYSLQGLALLLTIPPLVLAPSLAMMRGALEWAPMRWMGRRSYGAYLWHYVALSFTALLIHAPEPLELDGLRARLTAIPIALALTWVLAAISYETIFRPSQRLKPFLTPRADASAGESAELARG